MRSSDNHYWVALDHVRALACLTVFAWHFLHSTDGYPVPFTGAPVVPPFALLDEGHTGVAVFMTLSGYLFAKLLDGKTVVFSQFYINRALRLFPLLILVMALKAIEIAVLNSGSLVYYATTLLTGLVLPRWPNGGWSITAELHFYLVLPIILLAARRDVRFLLVFLVLAVAMRAGYYYTKGSVQWLAYWTIVGRIDQFLLGIFFFYKRDWIATRIPLAVAILAGFYAFFWVFNDAGGFYQLGGTQPSPSPLWIVMPTLEGLAYAVAIAWYDARSKSEGGFGSRLLADYGKFSYSIYLLHFFVVFRAAQFIDERVFPLDNFYVALAAAVAVFLAMYPIGWLSYRYVEEPFLRFRKRYTIPRSEIEPTLLSAKEAKI